MQWSYGLQDLSQEEINRALDKCRTEVRFPPTLPEFFQLARSGIVKERTNHEAYIEFKPTKKIECDPEIAKLHLEKMKQVLRYGTLKEFV